MHSFYQISWVAIIQGDNWLDENFSRWGSVWELSVREFSWVGVVQVGVFWVEVFLGGSCPGGNFLGGSCPGGNFLGGSCPGGNFLGGNCPGGTYPGWGFSLVEVFWVGIVWWETSGWQFFGWEFSCYPSYHVRNSIYVFFLPP